MSPYIYLRALKHAEHTVFCVEDGQKTYLIRNLIDCWLFRVDSKLKDL